MDSAKRHVDIPETSADILKRFGEEDDGFLEYLHQNFHGIGRRVQPASVLSIGFPAPATPLRPSCTR